MHTNSKLAARNLPFLLLATLLGCTQTISPQPNPVQVAPQNSAPPVMQPPTPASNAGTVTGGGFEQPPVINISEFLPANIQAGPGYYLGQQVTTNGAMGQYTIIANADEFGSDAGTYQVESLDLLKIRLSEIPAIIALDHVSSTGVFAKEVASSAAKPVADAAQMVIHPMDTVTGLPSGIGELFGRVQLGADVLYSTATNSSEGGEQRASETAGETANITLTALGYDQLRRNLARKLHVDPYSSDPILTKKLNHVAWIMFTAHMMVDTAMSVAVPGSMLITGVQVTDDLIYQTPKADLILLVERKLRHIGLSSTEIAAFSHNNAIPLSLQVAAVRDLETLGPIRGRRSAAVALSNVVTEYQARFLVTSLRMLVQWSQQNSQIARIQVRGVLIGRDQDGTVIMPAPVDYVSWTPRIAGFATDPELLGLQNRVLWITGKMTPLARQQLTSNGWTLREGPLQGTVIGANL
ncbi:MAG TPA: hypothetical protein VJ728_11485 [Candidatus Binataceae bacterium]|nr:hypothetical protein [Candidatus Binataceae bacterium]